MEIKKSSEDLIEEKKNHEDEIEHLEEEITRLQNKEKGGLEKFTSRIIGYGALSLWIIVLYYLLERIASLLLKRLIVAGLPVPGIVASLIVAYSFQPSKRIIFNFLKRHF